MKILFLHLSDLHVKDRSAINTTHIKKMCQALNVLGESDEVVFIISGDCASSGEKNQYTIVWKLIGNIIRDFREATNFSKKINVIVVPGNHDMDFSSRSLTAEELNDIFKENYYDKEMASEIEKQRHFFEYANLNKCFIDEGLYCEKNITFEDYTINFNLLNSGLFSLKRDEDKGLHYLPNHVIDKLAERSEADISFLVMHHAPEWFCDDIKHKLEKIIADKFSMCFYGHEHYLTSKSTKTESAESTVILNGGALCENCNWNNSAFEAGLFDTKEKTYENWQFVWNRSRNMYEHNKNLSTNLKSKNTSNNFVFDSKFLNSLIKDSKKIYIADYKSRFVFPRIVDDLRKNEITSFSKFKELILSKKKILLYGNSDSGKTYLLKYLFENFSQEKSAIYIDANDISGSKMKRIIKNTFQDIYGADEYRFKEFEQLPKTDKILFLDNIDCIKHNNLKAFLETIDSVFGFCVFSSKEHIELDIYTLVKERIDSDNHISKYNIAPWYSDKRVELIRKVAKEKLDSNVDFELITNQLNDSIKSQRNYFSWNPDFITQFVEYYCDNVGQLQYNDSSVFSKVFEANITNQITANIIGNVTVQKTLTLLSKIAYQAHKIKEYPIKETTIQDVINKYNEEYGDRISSFRFLELIENSKIVYKHPDQNAFYFQRKSYYPYFIAREINLLYHENGDDTDVKNILYFACFGVNADILLFLIYLTENTKILNLILDMVSFYTADWKAFKFKDHDIGFLKVDFTYDINQLTSSQIEEADKKDLEEERIIANNDTISIKEIYDYNEESVDELVNQLIRAIALLSTVSRCLPAFEHIMKKEEKSKFIDAIYTLPNKIFYVWAKTTDDEREKILLYIWRELLSSFKNQNALPNMEKELKEKTMGILLMNSISLLLDIYSNTVQFSTKNNTIGYLSEYSYIEDSTYSLMHLMMLSNRSKVDDFTNEAGRILDNEELLPSVMVRIIANHALRTIKSMGSSEKNRLIQKCFPNNKKEKMLLAANPIDTPNE